MGEDVSHFVGNGPGYFRLLSSEFRKPLLDAACGFADDLEIADHRILRLWVREERDASEVSFTVVMPPGDEERRQAEFGAFTEWGSDLDRAYDVLGKR
jgi:hypothetical protein